LFSLRVPGDDGKLVLAGFLWYLLDLHEPANGSGGEISVWTSTASIKQLWPAQFEYRHIGYFISIVSDLYWWLGSPILWRQESHLANKKIKSAAVLTREVRLIFEGCLQLDLNLKLPRVLVTASLVLARAPSCPMLEENIESTNSRLSQAWLASYLVTLARVSLVPTIYNFKRESIRY